MNRYRVVRLNGEILVEQQTDGTTGWFVVQHKWWDSFWEEWHTSDRTFRTVLGAAWWIKRHVRKEKRAAREAVKRVVWGPYP